MELVQPCEGEWIFQDAAITNEIESKFVEALDAYDDGLHEEAEANDNQGVRYLLPKCWFEVNDAAAVIDLCQRYADDTAPETLYSHALALAITKRTNEAREVLQHCVQRLPLVAKELLSRRHPEPARKHSGAITLGGQAWEYWKEYGRYWRRSKSARTLLREAQEGATDAGQ